MRATDQRQAVLTLYREGSEPDPAVYQVLRRFDLDHVPELIETGHWEGHAYEVSEELSGGTLADIGFVGNDLATLQVLAREIGKALNAFAECGMRHRDLRPGTVLVRHRDPLDLVITGFGSARLSDLDLDIVSPLETSRYMAPEAIMGGVSAASDWWSLGMLLLEQVTEGRCFADVSEPLFIIHVLTNGAPIPNDLEPAVAAVLHGLLERDRNRRWSWRQVSDWLNGEYVVEHPPTAEEGAGTESRTIELNGRPFRNPRSFALEAARATNWQSAISLLRSGTIATWADEISMEPSTVASLRHVSQSVDVPEDFQLAIALKLLNPALPLIQRERIVNPGWLLDHPTEAYDLITGPAPEMLNRFGFESEGWLLRLKRRAESVRARAEASQIELEEDSLRIQLLCTSRARLSALWDERRRLMPETDHPALEAILDRPQIAEEDLILMVSAAPSQFRPRDVIIGAAAEIAEKVGVPWNSENAASFLELPRRDLYALIDKRIESFARCDHEQLDAWADRFRLERRLPLERVLVLLAIPEDKWHKPPHQQYVTELLGFFEKKVAGAILRGPLVRMTIGKTTPRVDVTELAQNSSDAAAILDRVLRRTDQSVPIDPEVFSRPQNPEQRLRNLAARTSVFQRDTGVNGLYLGFPFLLRRDRPGKVRPRLAPILLWPIKISAELGARGRVTVAFDRDRDEVRVNPAFEGLLGIEVAAKWRDAANELLARTSIRVHEVIDGLGHLASPRSRTLGSLPSRETEATLGRDELVCAAVLFHVEFLGQSIVEDLRHLKSTPPTGSALESMLRLNAVQQQEQSHQRDQAPDHFLLARSDPSQEEAISRAWQSPGITVQGPPGTGKSQTIVNLVADAIGRGRSLLVVCQKLPALEVVRKRLVAENLGNRLVMVTDVNRDRRAILHAIRDQLESLDGADYARTGALQRQRQLTGEQIAGVEAELDRHHAALSQTDELTGKSYYEILGDLLELEADQAVTFDAPLLRRMLADLSPAQVADISETCGGVARDWLPAHFEGSPLSVLRDFPADDATISECRKDLDAFTKAELERDTLLRARPVRLDIEEPADLRSWLHTHAERLRTLDLATYQNVQRWLQHFRTDPSRTGATVDPLGRTFISRLEALFAPMERLVEQHHDPELFNAICEYDAKTLSTWISRAQTAVKSVGFWGKLSPRRSLARWKIRQLLQVTDDGRFGGFLQTLLLERDLRPIRRVYQSVAADLGLHTEVASRLTVRETKTAISSTHAALNDVSRIADVLAECPLSRDVDQAALKGIEPPFAAVCEEFEAAVRYADARNASLDALGALAEWTTPEFAEHSRKVITSAQSTGHLTQPVAGAWLSVGPYQRFRTRARQLQPTILDVLAVLAKQREILDVLEPAQLPATVRYTILREAYLGWKYRLESAEPLLHVSRDEIAAKVERLGHLDHELRQLNREYLAYAVDRARVGTGSLWEDITRVQGPRAIRLREFFDRGSTIGLLALRPVWLVNPEVASQLLPRQRALFDMVIYDEASQMPVEYALPTLFRASVAVVSGDEKQMPPTSFFSSKIESDEAETFDGDMPDEETSEEERIHFEETWNRREIKDCPDLLHLAGAALATTTLQIHYRSAYRELIAFSNSAFYREELSIPARHPDAEIRRARPIHVMRVDGIYRDQTNELEARRVADVLAEIWGLPQVRRPSVGVVTFNRKQADLIEEVLEERAECDAVFRDAYSQELERVDDGEDMAVFVKNVENVQGDERDIIIFSTTFGRNPAGVFRRNFGVLGQQGGERRLNVATTRARHKVMIVTSIPTADVSDFLNTRRAPSIPRDYLQGYLEYAHFVSEANLDAAHLLRSRFAAQQQDSGGNHTSSGFGRSVEAFLRSLGHEPVPTGRDPALAVDFGVVHPQTGQFAIGIECQPPAHRLLRKARAREIWRPAVLARAFPIVHRISPHAWYHDRKEERRRLVAALEAALGTRETESPTQGISAT